MTCIPQGFEQECTGAARRPEFRETPTERPAAPTSLERVRPGTRSTRGRHGLVLRPRPPAPALPLRHVGHVQLRRGAVGPIRGPGADDARVLRPHDVHAYLTGHGEG